MMCTYEAVSDVLQVLITQLNQMTSLSSERYTVLACYRLCASLPTVLNCLAKHS